MPLYPTCSSVVVYFDKACGMWHQVLLVLKYIPVAPCVGKPDNVYIVISYNQCCLYIAQAVERDVGGSLL
jgi:hypothetical protein